MPIPLKDLLSLCLKNDDWRLMLIQQWPSIIGPLSTRVSVEKIVQETLIVGVNDSCLLQELYLLSPLLLSTIQKSLGKPYIKQIRFKQMSRPIYKKQDRYTDRSRYAKPVQLTRVEQHALACIEDPELKEVLRTFCIRCHRERDS